MTGNHSEDLDHQQQQQQEEESPSVSVPQHQNLVYSNNPSSPSVCTDDDASAITNDLSLVTMKTASSPTRPSSSSGSASSVQVAVRVRPLLSSLESGCGSCIHILPPLRGRPTTIQIGPESTGPTFTFDEVFPISSTQVQVYEHRVAPLVERCLEGYNATILAYGQTGSGKTHTVIGPSTCHSAPEETSSGMIPRAVSSLFQQLQQRQLELSSLPNSPASASLPSTKSPTNSPQRTTSSRSKSKSINNNKQEAAAFEFQVRVQFLEIYGEDIRDLLASSTTNAQERLTIRDIGNDEPEVVGATCQVVKSAEEALRCLTKGMLRRVTAATSMNESSSRSHAIFSILMEQSTTHGSGPQQKRSKFNFVDLAGSERQKRTRAQGVRLKEGIGINKGLLVLGNVISALGDPKKRGKAFVPYRDSKLTRLLKGSLGGNHKTLMITCVSPSSTNMEESLNCLRYANRAKNIQNRAVVNVDARTRMIAELKAQVQALAADLLRAKDSGDLVGGAFTRQDLLAIVQGSEASAANQNNNKTPGKQQQTEESRAKDTPSPLRHPRLITPEPPQAEQQQRLQDLEGELSRTTNQLKRCRTENYAVEERLHVTLAEKEFYKLQLEAVATPDGGNSPIPIDQAFVNRATEYEKEIGRLKEELRMARSHAVDRRDPSEADARFSIEKASQDMLAERERLAAIQNELLSSKSVSTPQETTPKETGKEANDSSLEPADSEEKAEEEHLTALTLKYSHIDDEDEVMIVDQQNTPRVVGDPALAQAESEGKDAAKRQAKIEADLLEISRVIESKEELISQLQCSQAKYSSMKEFYEGKLHEMEALLDQKEEERLKIIAEMERLKENNHDTKDLEEELKQKEEHIAGIRKQKLQLKDLTAVSSKNATEIKKLQSDVRAMKERKVSMQKQLADERKAHALEIKRLKKEVLQKDRETRKWQKISNQKASEAEKANQVTKMKVQQLGQLRAKYKDAEKTIRMLQIKKGVMAKAGLDSVIVGRRGKRPLSKDQSRDPANSSRAVDTDSLRDYFDKKVAEVGRKEALADKLARGWEEHMQLTLQRSELVEQETEESNEEIQALDLRIQYEEDRIRKLAHRLGKRSPPVSGDEKHQAGSMNSFLYGKDFTKLCKGLDAGKSSEIAARVLFGMVVRERRRIASLAKTASSLDEKLRECQMDNEAKQVAFRSYVQDSQQDFANISMNHQEQILSLMSLVKSGDDNPPDGSRRGNSVTAASDSSGDESVESSKLLILANERIGVLEQHLRELKAENKVNDSYRVEKEEIKASLAAKNEEYEKLEVRVSSLRATLRQIREELTKPNSTESEQEDEYSSSRLCLAIIKKALLQSPGPMSPMARRHSCPNIIQPETSPQSMKQWEFMSGADDDEDEADEEEAPDWADEIMEDLAFIAEGKLPPSLQGVEGIFEAEVRVQEEKKSVALKMPDLVDYNNTPPHASSKLNPPDGDTHHNVDDVLESLLEDTLMVDTGTLLMEEGPPETSTDGSTGKPESKFNGIADDAIGEITQSSSLRSSGSAKSHSSHGETEGSVFERLVNPTHFTGTQREKHHSQSELQKEHQESSAERLLDSLLESNVDIITAAPGHRLGEASTTRSNAADAARKIKEYTRQNVFERLTKTTTQSFAGKHPDTLHDGPSHDNRPKRSSAQTADLTPSAGEGTPMPTKIPLPSSSRIKSPARPKFKPKTSSRGTSPTRIAGRSPGRAKSPPPKSRNEGYTQQNVFERLTKTTTEAYAVKKRVVKN